MENEAGRCEWGGKKSEPQTIIPSHACLTVVYSLNSESENVKVFMVKFNLAARRGSPSGRATFRTMV